MAGRIEIIGSQVDNCDMEDMLGFIAERIGAGFFARIVTLNAEIAYRAYHDQAMREMINSADRVTPDGSGILWAAERLGSPIKERVSGIDLMEAILARSPEEGWRIFFLGSREETVTAAAKAAAARFPGLQIVGHRDGFFQEADIPDILRMVRDSGADLLFVGMGSPKQDFWLAEHGQASGAKIGIGVGGSFDVLSGQVRRAPKFMQRAGMEWLWRLLREPWRYKRTLALPKFMRLVKKQVKNQ